jgi:hypothetical protein
MTETSDNPTAYISGKWEHLYDKLCKGSESIFDQMTSLFTLCATIGHIIERPIEVTKPKKDIFKWINLNEDNNITVLSTIAWSSLHRDLSVLPNKKKIMEIACNYAEGGMQYLFENYFEDHVSIENGNYLFHIEKLDIEFDLAQIVEGLRQEHSIF